MFREFNTLELTFCVEFITMLQCPAVLPHRCITAVGLTQKNCTAVAVSGCGVSCGVQVWCAVCRCGVQRAGAVCSLLYSGIFSACGTLLKTIQETRLQELVLVVAQRYKNNVSRGQKEVLWYFSSIFQCNILAVLFSAVFQRYFGGIFQCLKLPIRYRYLGIWKKNTAYRHRTDFFPTAGHCQDTGAKNSF